MGPIALLSDFGSRDWYVSGMKAVIAGIAPQAVVIDITHEIPRGDVAAGAFVLLAAHAAFPAGTVFVAVVDPGVGGDRLPLIARAGGYIFAGPDNGILAPCLQRSIDPEVHELRAVEYRRAEVSATFHGRDIFAPAAAHAALGVPLHHFGAPVAEYRTTAIPPPLVQDATVAGRVLYIDRFGNAVTNVPAGMVNTLARQSCAVIVSRRRLPLLDFYDQVGRGKPLALVGSSGFVEISVNCGSAAQRLGLRIGTPVVVSARASTNAAGHHD